MIILCTLSTAPSNHRTVRVQFSRLNIRVFVENNYPVHAFHSTSKTALFIAHPKMFSTYQYGLHYYALKQIKIRTQRQEHDVWHLLSNVILCQDTFTPILRSTRYTLTFSARKSPTSTGKHRSKHIAGNAQLLPFTAFYNTSKPPRSNPGSTLFVSSAKPNLSPPLCLFLRSYASLLSSSFNPSIFHPPSAVPPSPLSSTSSTAGRAGSDWWAA